MMSPHEARGGRQALSTARHYAHSKRPPPACRTTPRVRTRRAQGAGKHSAPGMFHPRSPAATQPHVSRWRGWIRPVWVQDGGGMAHPLMPVKASEQSASVAFAQVARARTPLPGARPSMPTTSHCLPTPRRRLEFARTGGFQPGG
jgi:hypothetical protein